MADEQDLPADDDALGEGVLVRPRRMWPIWLAVVLVALVFLTGLALWLGRERIAENVIEDQLKTLGLPALYEIESIGPKQQVLRNLVIGDPQRPDFTAARIVVSTTTRWGVPGIGQITLEKPRIYGTYNAGKLSFGALDPVLFTGSKEPFRFPDLDVKIVDGRGLLESDLGDVAVTLDGAGPLRDGFAGRIAALSAKANVGPCRMEQSSLFGEITLSKERPHIKGPLRFDAIDCPGLKIKAGQSMALLDLTADSPMDGFDGLVTIQASSLSSAPAALSALAGPIKLSWRKKAMTAQYEFAGRGLNTSSIGLGAINLEGMLRTSNGFSRVDLDGTLKGGEIKPAVPVASLLAPARKSAAGTLAEPLLAKVQQALVTQLPGSEVTASYRLRRGDDGLSLVIPQAVAKGQSGDSLITLSRAHFAPEGQGLALSSGQFSTGGAGLPQIAGQISRSNRGQLMAQASLREYVAGSSRIEVPRIALVQSRDGTLGISGLALMSGAFPGGEARNLSLPLSGSWNDRRGLALWRRCVTTRFDQLRFSNLMLANQQMQLCPAPGRSLVEAGGQGLRVAAGAPSLAMSGTLGTTPIRLTSGPLGIAFPGALNANMVDVVLGRPGNETQFKLSKLTVQMGKSIGGTFADSQMFLASVPIDLIEASGNWNYQGGRLTIQNPKFRVFDRVQTSSRRKSNWNARCPTASYDDSEPGEQNWSCRFQPLIARDGLLVLEGSSLIATAMLREPRNNSEVVKVDIVHDLQSGVGSADLTVPALRFEVPSLQPADLTNYALGVIANARGTVTGKGRIDWDNKGVTSSGTFSSDSFDFAGAFGPAKGVSGQVVFTDLLGLVTAPDQRLKIRSINPGIEANDGELSFALLPGRVLQINEASWPFLDGSLRLEPSRMVFGQAETRRFTLTMSGLDAARFIERMDMSNIAAKGTFDGSIPLVFDHNGGRIEGGRLISRSPGGNLSYIGALTYQDLSPMANFAFDSLKSLDFRRMQVDLGGSLTGEIITKVSFDGIRQGQSAKRNFITRQVAKLPIQFNVNIRAHFFELFRSLRAMYDPDFVPDPRVLQLLDTKGKRIPRPTIPAAPDKPIQPPVSEKRL